jgi:pimeloyl-ACP methyl ester carboxylesterase
MPGHTSDGKQRAMHARAGQLAGLLLLLLAGCTWTAPFRDQHGRVIPGSVASMERLVFGGADQAVWFRARDASAPALVILHGGPGASESALFRHYDAELENHFLVVYWEQRGAGRSYTRGLPRDSMTIGRMLRDLDELVDSVRVRFGHESVVLLGHSWGTILGTLYTHAHPEKVAAYVGVAQIAEFAEGERVSLAWALSEAKAKDDAKALEALRDLEPAPASVEEELALGRWVERLGGSLRGGLSTWSLIRAALRTDEASLVDLVKFGQGNRFSLDALRPQYSQVDLTEIRRFDVPMVFMLGRHDWHVPAVLAAEYFRRIEAPCKRLIWFEASAHNPPFEEPEAFVDAMIEHVLPLGGMVESCPNDTIAPRICRSAGGIRQCPMHETGAATPHETGLSRGSHVW